MATKRGKKIFNKEELAEDWCFECKDGGELMICDYGKCLKAYHPACVEKDDSVWTSDKHWICGRHTCLICHGKSYYQCYCCDRAACSHCIGRIDFVHLKGKNGLCNNCLKLALLVEEDKNIDSDGESVDLRDHETYEGLFREYYQIVKTKEGIDKNKLLAGKAQLDKEKICQINSYSDKRCEKEDEQLSSDNEDFSDGEPQTKRLKKKRCTQLKTKMQSKNNSKKQEFVGWGSKALIDFLLFIGQDTREKLLKYDVSSIVTKYIEDHSLIHPVKKTRILCDVQLEAVFGKKMVNRCKILSLLESHFVDNEERLKNDELDDDLEDDDTEILVAPKTEVKVEQNKISSNWYSTAAQSQFAALIPENINLIYLKKSLVMELIKQPESIETKIIGSFVRVKLDPRDSEQCNSHQLMQITGIKLGSSDTCNSGSSIQVSNMAGDVSLTKLSDAEISEEECNVFREKVKAGLLKKLTIVELEQKAQILHEDITKHNIAQELQLLQNRIDRANEKGWRDQLTQSLEKRHILQQPWYLSFKLLTNPVVIPEEVAPFKSEQEDGASCSGC
ncbi:uncharacterized protein At5g08430-like [Solanum stenotomum]|uniref:uncharacterized protein At5g08430-like n=1 Tax=Solanum stenotomum TaxID=172797 RepID=UPI0020D19A14|nr:uncharacterized protein At5g08430-like [Solanum stenotomum]XP_049379621.1 uncharacterized protein At5g08430-like [Solanum stenotomum]